MLVNAVSFIPQFGRSVRPTSSCAMPTPRSKEPTCVDYKDRIYKNERSRTITYHDSEIDRYDMDTREDTRDHGSSTTLGFHLLHPPHTFFFGAMTGRMVVRVPDKCTTPSSR